MVLKHKTMKSNYKITFISTSHSTEGENNAIVKKDPKATATVGFVEKYKLEHLCMESAIKNQTNKACKYS